MIVRLAGAARDDLLEIWRHIARDSVAAAERQLDRLETAIGRLADFPDIGLARIDLGKDLRMLRVDRYAISIVDGIDA